LISGEGREYCSSAERFSITTPRLALRTPCFLSCEKLRDRFSAARRFQMLMSLDDLALIARVREACERDDYQLGEFAALAVQRYASAASDEEWVTALGQMGARRSPASNCCAAR
jgi:hypothetical protein